MTDDIQIDGTEKEKVNNYKYLGQIIVMENIEKEEGCKVSWKTNHCWRDDTVGQQGEVWKGQNKTGHQYPYMLIVSVHRNTENYNLCDHRPYPLPTPPLPLQYPHQSK